MESLTVSNILTPDAALAYVASVLAEYEGEFSIGAVRASDYDGIPTIVVMVSYGVCDHEFVVWNEDGRLYGEW